MADTSQAQAAFDAAMAGFRAEQAHMRDPMGGAVSFTSPPVLEPYVQPEHPGGVT